MAILTFLPGTISNWSATSSWNPSFIPTLGDVCIFTSSSATCSLNITLATCSQIDFTNYNKQFRFNANALQVYGTVSLGTQMGWSFSTTAQFGGYNFAIMASASITSNGATIGVPTVFYSNTNNNNVYTITDYLNISENFTTQSPNVVATTQTINGGTLSLYKGFSINSGGNLSTNLTTGTSNIVMLGTGTIATTANTSGGLGNNFTIRGTGTITLPTNIYYKTGLFSIIGTPTLVNNSILYVTGACSFIAASSSSTYILPFLITASTQTVTLLSDIHSSRGINSAGLTLNGFNYYIYGNLLSNVTTGAGGSAVYRISGTGSGSNVNCVATAGIANNIIINTPGSCTFTTNFLWSGTSFIYTAGNVTFPTAGNNSFLPSQNTSPTFDTAGMTFVNFSPSNTGTMSLNSVLTATTLTIPTTQDTKFTGSAGFITNTLSFVGNPATTRLGLGLAAGITYTVTNNLSITPTTMTGNIFGIRSLTPGSQTNFVLSNGASQSVLYTVGTDVNSSGGQTILPFYQGTTASQNVTNWGVLTTNSIQQTTFGVS